MPTYEYECTQCGTRFEKFQPITAAPLSACLSCSGTLVRLPGGGAGFIMKGAAGAPKTRCGSASPCCGRETPCGSQECDH